MKVDSSKKVAKLNADKLDGKDSSAFVSNIYTKKAFGVSGGLGSIDVVTASCDPGTWRCAEEVKAAS